MKLVNKKTFVKLESVYCLIVCIRVVESAGLMGEEEFFLQLPRNRRNRIDKKEIRTFIINILMIRSIEAYVKA